MFPANETDALAKVLEDYFAGNLDDGHAWITDEEEGELRGVAYYAPAMMADGTWYVYMIGIRPEYQGQGRGKTLMLHVENTLRASGQRLLLVETSGFRPTIARGHSTRSVATKRRRASAISTRRVMIRLCSARL
jgi:ribosomal protein S18 acetylase RimI-like enzyme